MTEAWVMLVYRVPREPSTPRIAIWRKLRRYGAYQLTDGVVLLPASPRTREQLEWVAEDAVSAGGSGEVWEAAPTNPAELERIRTELQEARGAEYAEIVAEAQHVAEHADPAKQLGALRRRFREITRRDHFPTESRETARQALRTLADQVVEAEPARPS
ncbi:MULTISPECIES: Chromate resistance protein ChrB [Gordonia]|uniref:Chromate resistance protein n=1 Tax=Gordonia terrae C-6 TaxID=1316928 RepID=R7Y3Z5_9ACTN|nr:MULTISPECIES: Chromate resistance protein ChrB [Gordonia]AFR50224.1 chromate resistance protein [Gordonia sp. KTR9]EON30720.1 chromate resistance protein [Gordonia terrae C-6]